ncbi:helix-turn-helix domain-containing protein [Aphanothece microscopica]|uniref:helix-turn-helix domain-containing protein n=1 Tax=Aphanothece microscopica TaxID=1049561 RepID=UPI0039856640
MASGYQQGTQEQRYVMLALSWHGTTQRSIAETLGVPPSTVSRELHCYSGKRGYRPL